MSPPIPARLVKRVRGRAKEFCEYCLLPQLFQEATFHVDHIQPLSAQGKTAANNLALACVTCSLKKAARTHARDPRSKQQVPLFHPRRQRWADHFRWGTAWMVIGRTLTGRATVSALGMNRPAIRAIRKALAALGQFPPKA
jgi:5-methylcytosine-specific restriction endonuclease McrA